MERERKYGLMVRCMRVGSKMIKQMHMEDLFMQMGTFILESGSMKRPRAMVSTPTPTVPSISVDGN